MSEARRPKPEPTEWSRPFWDACARGELVVQRCTGCRALRHYPQPMCPQCQSTGCDWVKLSGRGAIYSYTVAHRAFHPAFSEHVPYVLATIELDEGVRMLCDMPDVEPDAVAIGQRVEAYFEALPGQGVMPRFRIVG